MRTIAETLKDAATAPRWMSAEQQDSRNKAMSGQHGVASVTMPGGVTFSATGDAIRNNSKAYQAGANMAATAYNRKPIGEKVDIKGYKPTGAGTPFVEHENAMADTRGRTAKDYAAKSEALKHVPVGNVPGWEDNLTDTGQPYGMAVGGNPGEVVFTTGKEETENVVGNMLNSTSTPRPRDGGNQRYDEATGGWTAAGTAISQDQPGQYHNPAAVHRGGSNTGIYNVLPDPSKTQPNRQPSAPQPGRQPMSIAQSVSDGGSLPGQPTMPGSAQAPSQPAAPAPATAAPTLKPQPWEAPGDEFTKSEDMTDGPAYGATDFLASPNISDGPAYGIKGYNSLKMQPNVRPQDRQQQQQWLARIMQWLRSKGIGGKQAQASEKLAAPVQKTTRNISDVARGLSPMQAGVVPSDFQSHGQAAAGTGPTSFIEQLIQGQQNVPSTPMPEMKGMAPSIPSIPLPEMNGVDSFMTDPSQLIGGAINSPAGQAPNPQTSRGQVPANQPAQPGRTAQDILAGTGDIVGSATPPPVSQRQGEWFDIAPQSSPGFTLPTPQSPTLNSVQSPMPSASEPGGGDFFGNQLQKWRRISGKAKDTTKTVEQMVKEKGASMQTIRQKLAAAEDEADKADDAKDTKDTKPKRDDSKTHPGQQPPAKNDWKAEPKGKTWQDTNKEPQPPVIPGVPQVAPNPQTPREQVPASGGAAAPPAPIQPPQASPSMFDNPMVQGGLMGGGAGLLGGGLYGLLSDDNEEEGLDIKRLLALAVLGGLVGGGGGALAGNFMDGQDNPLAGLMG